MKILYAIQGTGNGHLSRATDVIPCLQKRAEVDVLLSGTQVDLHFPFEIKYQKYGFGFIFGKMGGVDLWSTVKKNKLQRLLADIRQLPVENYDLVINDFEPISAWSCATKGIPCVALSHQSAVLNPRCPKPEQNDPMGKFILKHYAPVDDAFGFHFKQYHSQIYTPVIRQSVRKQQVRNDGHYTVYLPSYDDRYLLENLSRFKYVRWDVFSKHNKKAVTQGRIQIRPIDSEAFVESVATSAGVLCGAGFETPAEVLFLQKKLLVIPMKNQYEQQLNAAALKHMGVPVIKSLKPKYDRTILNWLETSKVIAVDYPDETQMVIDALLAKHGVSR